MAIRLISPNLRRIYPNATSSKGTGVADKAAISSLHDAGWEYYKGPGQTDARGWIIPGTEPNIEQKAAG